MDEVWSFEHACECSVSKEFAWQFWTNVANWALDADVESVELDGPFREGAHGITHSKSSGRIEWQVVMAEPGRAVLEIPLPRAQARFVWTFEEVGDHTRIVQRIALLGEEAAALANTYGPGLTSGIPAGMAKLCEAMRQAAANG